jgi:hypothetical protein
MTLPSRIRVFTPGCHQNDRLTRNIVLAKPLPIEIQQSLNSGHRVSLRLVFHVNSSEKSFGSPMNAEYPPRGRR